MDLKAAQADAGHAAVGDFDAALEVQVFGAWGRVQDFEGGIGEAVAIAQIQAGEAGQMFQGLKPGAGKRTRAEVQDLQPGQVLEEYQPNVGDVAVLGQVQANQVFDLPYLFYQGFEPGVVDTLRPHHDLPARRDGNNARAAVQILPISLGFAGRPDKHLDRQRGCEGVSLCMFSPLHFQIA